MKTARKLVLFALLCAIMVCALTVTAFAATEVEENNNMAAAQAVAFNDAVSASISVEGDHDFYKVVLPSAGRITVTITSYMKCYSAYMYDPAGNTMWTSENNLWNETAGVISNTKTFDLLAGTYYFKVNGQYYHSWNGYKTTGDYTFNVSFVSAEVTEQEPNDALNASNVLGSAGTVKGHLAQNDKYDFYSINLEESGELTLNVTAYSEYSSLFLYDINGTELWSMQNNKWNATVGFVNYSGSVHLIAGTYFVKVDGHYYHTWNAYDTTGTYTLTSSFVSAKATETEPNNSLEEAMPIALDATINGQIALNDDKDFYALTLTEDGYLTIDLTSYLEQCSLILYDPDGNEVWSCKNNARNNTSGFINKVDNAALAAGTYYLRTDGKYYHTWNSYTTTGNYTLKFSFEHYHVNDEVVTPPTCTEQGFTTYTCTLCGAVSVDNYTDATGHTEVEDPAVQPTCTEPGLTAGSHCSTCNEVIIPQESIPAAEHILDNHICMVCGYADVPLGDVDNSGTVDFFDGMLVLQYYAGILDDTGIITAVADVDKSGEINFFDGMYILQYYAGILDKLPVEA